MTLLAVEVFRSERPENHLETVVNLLEDIERHAGVGGGPRFLDQNRPQLRWNLLG